MSLGKETCSLHFANHFNARRITSSLFIVITQDIHKQSLILLMLVRIYVGTISRRIHLSKQIKTCIVHALHRLYTSMCIYLWLGLWNYFSEILRSRVLTPRHTYKAQLRATSTAPLYQKRRHQKYLWRH